MKTTSTFLFSMLLMIGVQFHSTAQCVAGFDTTISGLTVQFTNQATGSYNMIEYDFGDGGWTQYVASPSHTYASAGIYEACQFIYDTVNWQCFDSKCDTLYLGGATCMANYYTYQDGLDVEFYDASLGQFDSIWFDFGDGTGSNDPYAIHSYSVASNYTVCLSIFDNGSLCDSMCSTVYVVENNCNADFTYSATGLTLDFSNWSSGDFDVQYWDFGDGFGWSDEFEPTYSYAIPGQYTVCLSVYDTLSWSCYDEYCEDILVTSGGGGGGPCVANYTYEQEELSVSFTNASSGYQFLAWDFGDGSGPVFDENPVYAFAEPGEYEVCLTVVSIFPPCTNTYCQTITVYEYTCEPDFSYSFNTQNQFSFFNTTTVGNVTSVLWSFGDGNTSTFDQPIYYYNSPGVYNVCLTTYDEGNECGVVCKDVEVYPVGVGELNSKPEFKVFPNPSKGTFVVQVPESLLSETLDMRILDVSGRIVFAQHTGGQSHITINTELPAGAYYLSIGSGKSDTHVTQILVQ
ncbi:MAG: PKD domain-containing protein [Flavobacteriales bacterium]